MDPYVGNGNWRVLMEYSGELLMLESLVNGMSEGKDGASERGYLPTQPTNRNLPIKVGYYGNISTTNKYMDYNEHRWCGLLAAWVGW